MFWFFNQFSNTCVCDDSHFMAGCVRMCTWNNLPAVKISLSCELDTAACVHILLAHVFVYVCVPLCLSVYPGLQLAVWGPLRFQPGVHMYLCPNVCVCEKETDRTLLWAPCCQWEKPIMGHARVSGTPPTNIIQTPSFPLICMDASAKRRLSCFLMPSGDCVKCFLLSLIWN